MKTVKLNESQLRKLIKEMYPDPDPDYVEEAWQEGEAAATAGIHPFDCPYSEGTEEYDAWQSAYDNALDYMGKRGHSGRAHLRGQKRWRHEP